MRQILCAMMSPNNQIVREIHRFGRDHDWQVELCGGRIPPGWSGDGVLTDCLPLEELKKIRNFERTPVVSHTLTPGGNVRTVAGDTRRIAEMIADYFLDQGFRNFAGMRPASPMVRRKRDFFEWEFTKKMNAVGL